MIEHANKGIEYYRNHIQHMVEELGPLLDGLDDSEWDDHFEARNLVDQQRALQKELERLRNELKHLRKNRDAEIQKAIADKLAEVEEVWRNYVVFEFKFVRC
jgi:DNA-binding transcriptional MerR regulator